MTSSKAQKGRELWLKPRFREDESGSFFNGYNVVRGATDMTDDEVYHVVEFKALRQSQVETRRIEKAYDGQVALINYLEKELEIVMAQLGSARRMYEHAVYLEPNSYMRKAHLKEYDLCLEKIRKEMSK